MHWNNNFNRNSGLELAQNYPDQPGIWIPEEPLTVHIARWVMDVVSVQLL